MAATTRLEARLAVRGQLRAERDALRRPQTRREWAVVVASLGGLAAFLGLPLVALVERSLAVGGGHSLEAYRSLTEPTAVLLAEPWEAILNDPTPRPALDKFVEKCRKEIAAGKTEPLDLDRL